MYVASLVKSTPSASECSKGSIAPSSCSERPKYSQDPSKGPVRYFNPSAIDKDGIGSKGGTGTVHRVRNRSITLVGGLAVVALLLGSGYLFSASSGAQQVAASARSLHEANAAAGSVALARASLAQAVVFSIDYELGVASAQARDTAIGEASRTLENTQHWADTLIASMETPALGEQLQRFVVNGTSIVDLLVVGSSLEAETLRTEELESTYVELASLLATRQELIVEEIRVEERLAGTVGWVARLVATLLVPAIAIVVYFVLVRRQFRTARVRMDAELRVERDLSLAKDEFITGISHELRTPLTSIYGFSEYLLESDSLDTQETRELLSLIEMGRTRLSQTRTTT